jgi:hypothetical protein
MSSKQGRAISQEERELRTIMIGKIFQPDFVPFYSSVERARHGGEKTPRTYSLFENKRREQRRPQAEEGQSRPMTQQLASPRDKRATLRKRIEDQLVVKFGENASSVVRDVVLKHLSLEGGKIKP